MTILVTVIHVLICLFLILVVLLQQGNAADWSGAFGGGGSQTAFGSRGAGSLLSRATTIAAILFMITSLSLTILLSRPGGASVIRPNAKQQNAAPAPPAAVPAPGQQSPAAPAPAPATPPNPEKK